MEATNQTDIIKAIEALQKLLIPVDDVPKMVNGNNEKQIHIKIYKITNPNKKCIYYGHTTQKYLSAIPANLSSYRGANSNKPPSHIQLSLFTNQDPNSVIIELVEAIYTTNGHTARDKVKLLERTPVSGYKIITQKKQSRIKQAINDETDDETDEEIEQEIKPVVIKPVVIKPVVKEVVNKKKADKRCECCKAVVAYSNWARHNRTKAHLENEKK